MKRKWLLNEDTFALISRRYARSRRVKEEVDTFEKIDKFGLKRLNQRILIDCWIL